MRRRVGHDDPVLGLERRHERARVLLPKARPEGGIELEALQRIHQRRVEPGAAPRARHLVRRGLAVGREEHLDRLREAADAREQRDPVTRDSHRQALPVPVLVEAPDRRLRGGREVEHPRDVGAALAARLHHFAPAAPPLHREHQHLPRLRDRMPAGHVRHRVRRRGLRVGPVVQLVRLLEPEVVGAEEVAEAGGIAGAAQVLEQEGIEEVRPLRLAQPQDLPDPHADDAAPDGVTLGLALGDVQRVGEGGDDFRETDALLWQNARGGPGWRCQVIDIGGHAGGKSKEEARPRASSSRPCHGYRLQGVVAGGFLPGAPRPPIAPGPVGSGGGSGAAGARIVSARDGVCVRVVACAVSVGVASVAGAGVAVWAGAGAGAASGAGAGVVSGAIMVWVVSATAPASGALPQPRIHQARSNSNGDADHPGQPVASWWLSCWRGVTRS